MAAIPDPSHPLPFHRQCHVDWLMARRRLTRMLLPAPPPVPAPEPAPPEPPPAAIPVPAKVQRQDPRAPESRLPPDDELPPEVPPGDRAHDPALALRLALVWLDEVRGNGPLTMALVRRAFAAVTPFSTGDLTGRSRTYPLGPVRQMAITACRLLTGRPLSMIGIAFGGRDHTTVLHAFKKYRALAEAIIAGHQQELEH